MSQTMRQVARGLWIIAGLVLVAGIGSVLYRHPLQGLEPALELAGHYLRTAVTPLLLTSAGLSLVLGVGAAAAEARARRARPAPARRPTLSPLAVVNEDVAIAVREMLVELGQYLRGVAASPEPDIIVFVDTLMDGAIRVGASDVHIHPLEAGTRIAFRVHGVLEEVLTIPREHHPRLINRIKVLSKLTLYKLDKPQDGHFPYSTPEGPADVRVSILPTNHGEAVALRIARTGVKLPRLTALGFPPALLERYQQILGLPQGVIFVAGATGSGKTTSLYASLGYIKESRGELTRIASIEDPVEFDVPLFAQTQVNAEQGFTFAQGLRSVLRQDPNVIMVGEIRDPETARTAIQAGLSGHLILTTIHANSAAGVFNRLIEMGAEPFLLASATVAAISQRLVRALCPHCREPSPISPEEAVRLDAAGLATGTFYSAVGCQRCGGTGYLGRTALYEMMVITPALRDAINAKLPTPQLQEIAMKEGMVPLLAAGVERARAGATTLREVFRVVGS
jgi:general secretion pathway protein E